jgi:hypothetical protein
MHVVKPDAETLLHRFSNTPVIEGLLQYLPKTVLEKARETIKEELKKIVEKEK